jgi:hypothetical protein
MMKLESLYVMVSHFSQVALAGPKEALPQQIIRHCDTYQILVVVDPLNLV